jgi:ferredoxin
MSRAYTITEDQLAALVRDLAASGVEVLAPANGSEGGTAYRAVKSWKEVSHEGPLPVRPLKAAFLPPTEPLFRWSQRGADVALSPAPAARAPRVVIGARPCDAAGVQVLDKVMGWDYKDEPWFQRREATTILGMGCTSSDDACFCGSVGLGPNATKGSDLFLTAVPGGYRVDVVTEKGEAFAAAHSKAFTPTSDPAPAPAPKDQRKPFEVTEVLPWLAAHFEDPFWNGVAVRCHGCGACAAVCPTCHCFDIVDEPEGVDRGVRRRNWDTCQTGRFTVHASGHNPRSSQDARYRQRVLHKFSIYPERFGEILCTGCGRCTRACPSGMDIAEVMTQAQELARTGDRP